jgi:hypothetical protein
LPTHGYSNCCRKRPGCLLVSLPVITEMHRSSRAAL